MLSVSFGVYRADYRCGVPTDITYGRSSSRFKVKQPFKGFDINRLHYSTCRRYCKSVHSDR